MKRLIVLLLFISETFILNAQKDTIWLLSGEPLVTSNYNLNIEDGILTYMNKRNKLKQIGLEYVFSVVDSNNKEKVVFESTTRASTYLNQMGDVPGGQDNHFFRATYTVIDNQLTFYIDSEVGNSVYPGIIDGNKITIIYKTGFEFVFKKQ